MGSPEEDMYSRKHFRNNNTKHRLQMLVVVILTNLITVYILTNHRSVSISNSQDLSLMMISPLSKELNSTREELLSSRSLIADLNHKLQSTTSLVDSLLIELNKKGQQESIPSSTWNSLLDQHNQLNEITHALGPHKLPFGALPGTKSPELISSFGAGCLRVPPEELARYMSYEVGGECPADDVFAQNLMLKGCEPLPRRRCHPKSPRDYVEPTGLPSSLWETPSDTSIVWDPYTCKNYACLVNREKMPGVFDCKDCFNLMGREKFRWLSDDGGINYGIDAVLGLKPKGTVRIGLDIGGGSGSFAARMRERNVTILTSSMNFDGPFNSFIASRGLIPIHMTVSHRFPFFENTLDIVHSMHVLSNWIPERVFEFILYDIYRILRPGGIFWLDHFFCVGPQLNGTFVPIIEGVGFNKLRWNIGLKLDRRTDVQEYYISALLEKPMT